MEQLKRRDLEAECLVAFKRVLEDVGLHVDGQGYGSDNRFDAGFTLVGQQRFQFGDLRVALPDRTVIVEVESGGGLTNLVKYWPLAASVELPILLLHAFGQGSVNDYLSHLCLWEFVWQKMRAELWASSEPKLFAKHFRFSRTNPYGLDAVSKSFRACLTQPFAVVVREVFGFASANEITNDMGKISV